MHARWLAALAICTGCGFSIPAAGDDQGPDGHGADDTPWLAGWSYRRPITLKSSLLNEDLVDFPVMIPLANEQLGDHTLADRADLAFTTDDGTTRLDREIESKLENDTTVWVKVSLSAMANTTIYVYYGNPVPPTLPPDQVWTASFHAVYHLQQDPSTGRADDSTVHAHHGTPEMLAAADGQIGRAIHFNDRKSHVSISDFGIGEKFTISMWMNMNNDSGMQTLFANSSRTFDADTKGFRMYLGENRTLIFETGNGNRNQSKSVTSTNAITTGAWHHVAALVDRAAGMA
jgi:hypothetical protein